MNGILYLVSTPIGNLSDITYRALEILKKCDIIYCEDTRTSKILLQHYSISTTTKSYHQHNEHHIIPQMIDELKSGKNLALISDAGTPSISDPGFLITRECILNQINVEHIGGACAFLSALICSGLPSNSFVFEGFLPTKKGRKKTLELLSLENRTIILYESPYRVVKLIDELISYFGEDRLCCFSREISKKFEEHIRGNLSEIKTHFMQNEPKGEFVIIINGIKK